MANSGDIAVETDSGDQYLNLEQVEFIKNNVSNMKLWTKGFILTPLIVGHLHVFSPEQFEYLVGTLYDDMGYEAAVTQKSSDAGVDVWAQRNGERVAIQVKQNSEGNTVGRPVLQKISSTIAKGDADQAVVVTSSTFADTAETYARDFGTNMELIDGDKLVRMLSESNVPPPVAEAQ
jgi:HJR/Mrr/RecB family endonuclease